MHRKTGSIKYGAIFIYLSSMHLNSNWKSLNVQYSYYHEPHLQRQYRVRYSYYHGSTCITLCAMPISNNVWKLHFRCNFSVKNCCVLAFLQECEKSVAISVCLCVSVWISKSHWNFSTFGGCHTALALQTSIRSNCFPLCFTTLILRAHFDLENCNFDVCLQNSFSLIMHFFNPPNSWCYNTLRRQFCLTTATTLMTIMMLCAHDASCVCFPNWKIKRIFFVGSRACVFFSFYEWYSCVLYTLLTDFWRQLDRNYRVSVYLVYSNSMWMWCDVALVCR